MKVSFLIHHGYGIGGTIRTTFNLAQALAERHEVEIVSVFRHRDRPAFPLDGRVRLYSLVDMRRHSPAYAADDPLAAVRSRVFPTGDGTYSHYSELTDQRIGRWLHELDSDVVIGTRPGLNVHLAAQAPHRLIRVAQEHLTFDAHPARLKLQLRRRYPQMDAVTTVTEADAATYRRKLRLPGVRVVAVPNGVPEPPLPPSDTTNHLVIAAGRLVPVKQYNFLVRSFAHVARVRPDWKLRIYGAGPQRDRLRRLVDELGLYNNVFLMGARTSIEAELVKGSIAVSTSRIEAFGMSIVEAMRCGLPVVSTACPLGPLEIIDDGTDGRLVRPGDHKAFADALLELIADDSLRRNMGRRAAANAARYDPAIVAAHMEELLHSLVDRRRTTVRTRHMALRVTGRLLTTAYAVQDVRRAVTHRLRTRTTALWRAVHRRP
ncbi:glycosyltransferase family 4 protein [Streptomyces sp. NPDC002845]